MLTTNHKLLLNFVNNVPNVYFKESTGEIRCALDSEGVDFPVAKQNDIFVWTEDKTTQYSLAFGGFFEDGEILPREADEVINKFKSNVFAKLDGLKDYLREQAEIKKSMTILSALNDKLKDKQDEDLFFIAKEAKKRNSSIFWEVNDSYKNLRINNLLLTTSENLSLREFEQTFKHFFDQNS